MTRYKAVDPHPDFSKIEEDILAFWERENVFEKSLEKTQDGKPFTFYDGPPFATGLPHYGHILASTVKDLIPRYQTMHGRFVRRRWGWDCHGLPIEEIVERELNISGKKQIEEIGIKKFVETCRSFVLRYADEWGKTVRRIARWVDFENSYKTMDATYMESVWWAFKKIWERGDVYEGRKVLLYCPRCETPISNFEVAMDNSYKDVEEEAVTVKFKVKGEENKYLLAWTTTPWTLPGNVALAVGDNIEYAKVKHGEETLIVAKERVSEVFGDSSRVLEVIQGKDLVGLSYEPLFEVPSLQNEKSYRVYAAEFVTTEEGTGIVHTAVVYGEDDYNLGVKVGLPVVPLLDDKGNFNDKAPGFVQGVYLKDAEAELVRDLEKRGLLYAKQKHVHSYPYCWRCGTQLFYNAIPSWFVNVQAVKKDLIKSNEKQIEWYPSHLKHGRYEKSVESAPDWNISRNRYWGNPIPVWKCTDSECAHPQIVGSLKELNEKRAGNSTRLLLMRHGEALSNVGKFISSYPETKKNPLTENGRQMVADAAKKLEREKIDLIISSDIERAKETAEIIARELDLPVSYDPELREVNAGPLNGHGISDYHHYLDFIEEHQKENPLEIESYEQMCARIVRALWRHASLNAGKNILVVGHGGPLLAGELLLTGRSYDSDDYKRSRLGLGEYVSFEFPNWPFNDRGEVDLHRPYIDVIQIKCEKCGGTARRITEIFDSWFEASAMPFAEYHYPFENEKVFTERYPAQFVAEYIAQTRAWFYTMHVMNYLLFDEAPFENVVTTGTILAEDGSKMSKSKENFPDPWDVMEKYGVDSLRFYLMNSVVMQADNLNFSERDLQNVHRKVFRILWNVYNYFVTYANEAEWEFNENTSKDEREGMNVLDKWIEARLKKLITESEKSLSSYSTVSYTRGIEEFVDDLSTWYVRRSRGRSDAAFFLTLYRVLFHLSQIMAPVAPFMAEKIFSNLREETMPTSVHLTDWPEIGDISSEGKRLLEDMEKLRTLASLGLSARAEKGIKVRQALSSLSVCEKDKESISYLAEILKEEVNVKEIQYIDIPQGEIRLDTKLTPELVHDGRVREIVRAANALRKKEGLQPADRIVLFIDSVDFAHDKDELIRATRADEVVFERQESLESTQELVEGDSTLWVGIKKV